MSLGFLVFSLPEARLVQGLLLALGEDYYADSPLFPNELKTLRRAALRKRVKASVDVFLWQCQVWQDGPLYNLGVPVTRREAWMSLAEVFHTLEIHPMSGGPPSVFHYQDFGTRKLFGVIRVLQG